MNVVILTPDRVGSTLLQRLITVYMQFHQFDQPVINLHELTNGIIRYYSPVFNCEVLGKEHTSDWGYHQTLPEITDMLRSVPHYKTSRLAQYHIKNRQDSIADQLPFYQYLNDNFFVISAQRDNLLEHALSWCIFVVSRTLNVYSHADKFKYFSEVYQRPIRVERENLHRYLDNYREYLDWVGRHFHVHSYFHYDRYISNLEDYILNLPIFHSQSKRLTWQDNFDLGFQDWNRCHYLCSDMSGFGAQLDSARQRIGYDNPQDLERLELAPIQQYSIAEVVKHLSSDDRAFLQHNGVRYKRSIQAMSELIENKILHTGVPVKLQTFLEKRQIIENFAEVVGWYNEWVDQNGLGEIYTEEELLENSVNEIRNYHAVGPLIDQQKDDVLPESPRLTNVRPQP